MQQKLSPYIRLMRLDQPIGILLVYWPCVWTLLFLHVEETPWRLLITFFVGAVITRSAGCIINDIVDRNLDKLVERTKNRPLASGELTVKQAQHALIGLAVADFLLLLTLPWATIFMALPAVGLIFAYPYMKRITWWPQAFLGLTFNWGVILAWVASDAKPALPILTIYLACFFWTLGYDTIYGHQDKKDDAAAGIKSTSLHLGKNSKKWINVFYASSIFLLGLSLVKLGYPLIYYGLPLGFFACHLSWQLRVLDLDSPESCLRIFKSNAWIGGLWFLPGLILALIVA